MVRVCVCVCVCLYVSIGVHVYVCFHVSVCLYTCVYLSLSMYVFAYPPPLSLSQCVCVYESHYVCLEKNFCLSDLGSYFLTGF